MNTDEICVANAPGSDFARVSSFILSNPRHPWRSPDCFKPDWSKIPEVDAADFVRGIDGGLVKRVGWGQYQAARSPHKEQLFNSGGKKSSPRQLYLARESIIAVAVLARLHLDFGWPKQSLGTESSDGAFDAATYIADDLHAEYIVCEVKKSAAEIDRLLDLMFRFGRNPDTQVMAKKEENAFKKAQALRSRRPPLFWAVGPGGLNYAFKMAYAENGLMGFQEIPIRELAYPLPANGAV